MSIVTTPESHLCGLARQRPLLGCDIIGPHVSTPRTYIPVRRNLLVILGVVPSCRLVCLVVVALFAFDAFYIVNAMEIATK